MDLSSIQPAHVLLAILVAFPFLVRLLTAISDWGEQWIKTSRYKDRFKHFH